MKTTCASLLLCALSWQAYAQSANNTRDNEDADKSLLCPVSPVQFSTDKLMAPGEVMVEANRTEVLSQKEANFSGNVDITSDAATIRADEAKIRNNGRRLHASGDVLYQDAQLKVSSD